ncbi:metal-dependent hydrolase [Marinobacterium mangrovicola]|uniref:LexA-binding, inner membrane-associated putative hydrolase n=1 Tax=Marinobacterium mangrovicola TaxID=1476959 RepID=A0A4R1GKF3_9GAMM|nr:zinc dependent phospholipase C family protein [Marinobacterium mangrovicola]TCK08897.1 LexA-binding, inner membrane-associated putative hydrolase [Marinobacterium mangrovicola]
MPFTPLHMGPGVLVKAILQSSFSLMVFGWAQIVMDIQPLVVMISGEGHLHGFSHTYIGAILLAIFSALSGKYLSEIGLFVLGLNPQWQVKISWWVCFLSAFIGTFSHVLLDSIMHSDVEPFFPASKANMFLGLISIQALHKVCLYSGLVGGALYFAIIWARKFNKQRQSDA